MKPDRTQVFAMGLVAGLIGYVTIALVFALANLLMGRSAFYTAALMGEALFYGLRDPAAVTVVPAPVFAYNGLHLVVFLALGTIAAWLAWLAEKGPQFWYLGTVFFIFVMFHMFGAFLLFTEGVRAAVPVWLVMGASLLAGATMGLYLLSQRPALRAEVRDYHAGA